MRYRVPPRLAHVIVEPDTEPPTVYLLQLPDGEPLILKGAGGIIWMLAADGADDVPAAVAAAFECPVETVADDVRHFLNELVTCGLLELDSSQSEEE